MKCSDDVGDQERIAKVRLVGTVFEQRFLIRDARILARRSDGLAVGELLEHAGQHRLDRREHVVLRDEAHLEVELVEFARRPVGAGVLVAEAGRDLEIAVEARDHDQLLEHLRRLRKRVEFARVDPARHEIVARALGRARGQDRGLELGEALLDHPPPDRGDHGRAQHDVGVDLLAPEVEIAIFEADFLGIVLLAGDRHRQLLGRRLNGHLAGADLDLAGRQVGIHRLGRACDDLALDGDDGFDAEPVERLERRRFVSATICVRP